MIEIVNPATEERIGELALTDFEKQATQLWKAQPGWASRPLEERVAIIRRFGELLVEKEDELALTLTRETGKPISHSYNELRALPARIDFFCSEVEGVLKTEQMAPGEEIRYEPLGIIGNISAWNYPYFVSTNVVLPALLTGNAVIFKPSEFAALSGMAMCELLHEAGDPKNILLPLIGDGRAGAALLDLPIDGLFFTGSRPTGEKILSQLRDRPIPVQLELGGKDAAYICDDADIAQAAASVADGVFYNCGQSCCAIERIYVHEKVYDEFVEHFIKEVDALKMGDPLDPTTSLGPLTRPQQRDLLSAQITDAVEKGAQILRGGRPRSGPGYFFEPTVLTACTHEMDLMIDESFGPIIGIALVTDDKQAFKLMDDSDYGLTAAVYSKSKERAHKILSRLDVGTAYWNCCDRVRPHMPWSGRRWSGLGATLSHLGIRAFTQPKAMMEG